MPTRVFVTGGSGFVGAAVIEHLLARGHAVNALARGSLPAPIASRVQTIPGDLFDPAALDRGLAGCDAVVHLVGIIMERPGKGVTFERVHVEGTRAVVEAARRAGVRRFVHMSALGARPDAPAAYHRTKHAAEELVRGDGGGGDAGGSDWTIFRPSLIHGPRGEFTRMEADFARRRKPPFLFMPYFGAGPLGRGGAGRLQPVFVDDVARAFADALEEPGTSGHAYCLGGPDVLTWPALHHAMAEAVVGRRRPVVPMPVWQAKLLARVVPNSLLGFNRDQVLMSQEDSTCDPAPFTAAFGWTPRGLRETLAAYAKDL